MAAVSAIFVLVAMAGLSTACPAEYEAISPQHTMCLTDKGQEIPVTDQMRDNVLNKHNEIRAAVQPPAANMQKLVWDADLATVAAKWARQCTVGHDTYNMVPSLPNVDIGQNAAGGYSDLLDATNGWRSEIVNFTYGVDTNMINGHYTQIIFANTARVGCGEANCSAVAGAYSKVQICNYAPGQTGTKVSTEPYVKSTAACSNCSSTCDTSDTGALCVCSGKICYNGGTLHLNTCTCSCSNAFKGDLCQEKNCPEDTKWKCDYYFSHYTDPCIFQNVKEEDCPHQCGFC